MNLNRLFELAGLPNNDLLLEAAYDGMIDSLKKTFPNNINDIDENIKKAKKLFTAPNKQSPTNDKMVWYIKVLRASLSNNINNAKGSYNFTNMETFNNDLFHYYGYNIPQIFDTELNNQNISELFQTLNTIVQNYQKSDKPPVPVVKGDYELIKCNDGTSWWYVNRAYCEEEGRSGKHCGNVMGQDDTSQRILSLRTPNHNVILTFILLDNGYLGEMKAKANQKPSTKYHPNIMQLLLNPKIKGIKGAGYAPYMNFSIFDLSEQNIEVLINHGKQKFIADQIKAEPIEFLKAPEYIKANKDYQTVAIKALPALKHLIGSEKLLGAWENAIHEEPSLIIYAPQELHNFKELVISHLKYEPEDILKAPKSVSQNFDILKEVIEYRGENIQYVIPNTPRYNELCIIAIENNGTLEYIPTDYYTFELCKTAIENNVRQFRYIPSTITNYTELCKLALSKSSFILSQIPVRLRTYELCKIAVERDDGVAIEYVPSNVENYEELCKLAIVNGSLSTMENIPQSSRTYNLCKAAILKDWRMIRYVSTRLKEYEELCNLAIDTAPEKFKQIVPNYITDIELKQKMTDKVNKALYNESLDFKYFQTL